MSTKVRAIVTGLAMCVSILVLPLVSVQFCRAQAADKNTVASLSAAEGNSSEQPASSAASKSQPATATPDPEISPAVARQFAAMQAEIEALKAELKSRDSATVTPTVAPSTSIAPANSKSVEASAVSSSADAAQAPTAAPEKPKPADPFAYADWTWLNGNPRNKDVVWDSKFFTPEIRMDAHYVMDFNHPKDDTMGGSTEIFRSNELQVEQISFGGNLHWQNVNARILTMAGMFGVTTPRNDASAGRGQWDLRAK